MKRKTTIVTAVLSLLLSSVPFSGVCQTLDLQTGTFKKGEKVANKVEVIRSSTPIEYTTTRPNKVTVVILNEDYAPFISEAPEK